MDYNNILKEKINSKFSKNVIGQFGIYGNTNYFMNSCIGQKLLSQFDNFNNEYKKLINNNINAVNYLFDIRKNMYLDEKNQILNSHLIELLCEEKEEKNNNLRKSFQEIINYIDSLHYIENTDDCNNEFIEIYYAVKEILHDENTDIVDLESGISFFEELKNNFRGKNQQAFEYYDNFQEKYFQLLEKKFNVKYDNIPDKWDLNKN